MAEYKPHLIGLSAIDDYFGEDPGALAARDARDSLLASRGSGQGSCDWAEYHEYGDDVLELKGLSYRRLRWLRHLALAGFYLKNFRLLDLAKYLWQRRPVYSYALERKFGIKFVTKENFTG